MKISSVVCLCLVVALVSGLRTNPAARRHLEASRRTPLMQQAAEKLGKTDPSYTWHSWLGGPACTTPPRLPESIPTDDATLVQTLELVDKAGTGLMSLLESVNITAGFALGVVYNQQTLFNKTYGVADIETKAPVEMDTVFRIASMTKILTSLGFLKAKEDGLMYLDQPVTDFFNTKNPPEWAINNPFSEKPITMHALAGQMSGLMREAPCIYLEGTCTEEHIFEYLNSEEVFHTQYTGPHYSNLGLSVLGRSVERAVGVSYEDYTVNKITSPMGMSSTGFNFTKDITDRQATGYSLILQPDGSYQQVVAPDNTVLEGWIAPCGGAYSTTDDLMSLAKFVFNDNQTYFEKDTLNEWFLPGYDFNTGVSGFGLGTFERYYAEGYWVSTKGGLFGGYASGIALIPELKLGVTLLINIDSGSDIDLVSAQVTELMILALLEILPNYAPISDTAPGFDVYIGEYGVDGETLLTIDAVDESTGRYSGTVLGTPVEFEWEPVADLPDVTAMHYSAVNSTASCMASYSLYNDGIVYFQTAGGANYVSITDVQYIGLSQTSTKAPSTRRG